MTRTRIHLAVRRQAAEAELRKIPHHYIRRPTTLPNHWHVDPNGNEVCWSSACWLYCWAKASESRSETWAYAGRRAIDVLDHIFNKNFNFAWFDANVDHIEAQRQRYINRANHGPHCF